MKLVIKIVAYYILIICTCFPFFLYGQDTAKIRNNHNFYIKPIIGYSKGISNLYLFSYGNKTITSTKNNQVLNNVYGNFASGVSYGIGGEYIYKNIICLDLSIIISHRKYNSNETDSVSINSPDTTISTGMQKYIGNSVQIVPSGIFRYRYKKVLLNFKVGIVLGLAYIQEQTNTTISQPQFAYFNRTQIYSGGYLFGIALSSGIVYPISNAFSLFADVFVRQVSFHPSTFSDKEDNYNTGRQDKYYKEHIHRWVFPFNCYGLNIGIRYHLHI